MRRWGAASPPVDGRLGGDSPGAALTVGLGLVTLTGRIDRRDTNSGRFLPEFVSRARAVEPQAPHS